LARHPKMNQLHLHRCCLCQLLIGGVITTIIILQPRGCFISIGGGGRGPGSRRRRSFDVGGILLTHLFFIGVTEDDDLAVARRPKDVTADVTEKLFGELLISRGVTDETFLIQR
jgi:hypothetical protein